MKPVFINGIGIISRCVQSADDLKLICTSGIPINKQSGKIEFNSNIPSSKVRRSSRYMKLAATAANFAADDGKIPGDTDPLRIGTIISTGYGATESNIEFSDSVAKGNPALCSPTVFSSTVPNSCVGQICIIQGYKGVSTLLMGGDPMEYSGILLNTGKADHILCGSVEEYSDELVQSVMNTETASGCDLSEGAAIMTVSCDDSHSDHYCRITGFSSASLSSYPYVSRVSGDEAIPVIRKTVRQLCDSKLPDVIFTSENGTYFDKYEETAFREVFPPECIFASPKMLFGETLGSSYMMSAALAAAVLRTGSLPSQIIADKSHNKKIKTILVSGIDPSGNYCCMMMEV